MAKIGHPVAGDKLYGPKKSKLKILYLHSAKLEFIHPVTKKKIIVESQPDEEFNKFINKLQNKI